MMNKISKRLFISTIAMLPFAILAIITKLFFSKVYLLEWMYVHRYLYIWIVSAIIAFFDYNWGLVLSYGDTILIIVGEVVGAYIMNRFRNLHPEDYYMEYWGDHQGFWIWAEAFSCLIVVYGTFRIIKHFIVKRDKKLCRK